MVIFLKVHYYCLKAMNAGMAARRARKGKKEPIYYHHGQMLNWHPGSKRQLIVYFTDVTNDNNFLGQ